LYIVPTYGAFQQDGLFSPRYNQPAPPVNIVTSSEGSPGTTVTGTFTYVRNVRYKNPSPVIKIPKKNLKSIWDMTVDGGSVNKIDFFNQTNLQLVKFAPERIGSGSGPVSGDVKLSVVSLGPVTGPYGTADNTYATADQDPEEPGFTGDITQQMDYRADCDPRFQYIARSSPRTFGYTAGYLTGDGTAPNGFPTGAGISFPQNPNIGDYFLRIDYFPQLLYRWDGKIWVRISENVRTDTGFTSEDTSQLSSFINNSNVMILTNGTSVPQAQPLSSVLTIAPDPLPPVL
jgi:hypothetical protein